MTQPLATRGIVDGQPERSVLKLLSLPEFIASPFQASDCALWCDDSDFLRASRALEDIPWGALFIAPGAQDPIRATASTCQVRSLRLPSVANIGDVLKIDARRQQVNILYRRGSNSNSLLVTEHCNSYCIMCSQPPINKDETGRLEHLKSVIRLIDRCELHLGITGGEPTLLGKGLVDLLGTCVTQLPHTHLHVLTNGRRFHDSTFVARLSNVSPDHITWGIPVYSDAPEIHDFVVQRPGAFDETLAGLLNLARYSQRVEIRVVLQRHVVSRLRQLAHFIARNLPFVDQVSWMGLEPMGFARPNWSVIWIEPDDYIAELAGAIELLHDHHIATSIFNVPLCVLPRPLWSYAVQSISDWKNCFLEVCDDCDLKKKCCGFFSSVDDIYVPRSVHAVHLADTDLTARQSRASVTEGFR